MPIRHQLNLCVPQGGVATTGSLGVSQAPCSFNALQVFCNLQCVSYACCLVSSDCLTTCVGVVDDTAVCVTGSAAGGSASASGQNGDGHSLSQLPMSGPLTGPSDAQYNLGPSNPSQHHSGPQPWAMNEAA